VRFTVVDEDAQRSDRFKKVRRGIEDPARS
jgi:hypothetical protein